jgi:hypothetical protein
MNFINILKLINISLIVFLFCRQYNKKEEEIKEEEEKNVEIKEEEEKNVEIKEEEEKNVEIKEEKEEKEEKDVDTWYIIHNGETRYKGEWKDGLPHGKGMKEIFEGEHKDADGNLCNAKGIPRSWSIIECTFVDGLANGYGKQIYKQEGEKTQPYYEGEFYNGYHHGQGAYYFGNGSYYKGNFKEGKFHGMGYHYYVKKDKTWVGEFNNDYLSKKGAWIVGKLI